MTPVGDGVPTEVLDPDVEVDDLDRQADEIRRRVAERNQMRELRRREQRGRLRLICLAGAVWEVGIAAWDISDGLFVLIPLACAVFFLIMGRYR